MRTPKIYLETTLFNFFFADDAPEKKLDTIKLFQEIKDYYHDGKHQSTGKLQTHRNIITYGGY